MKIIVDAMGGDNAPQSTVLGAAMAVKEYGVDITLVGREKEILEVLNKNGLGKEHIEIIHADEIIDMCDHSSAVVKEKKNSSMGIAMQRLSAGAGDVLVSSGNTGALLTGGTLVVKRIKGVKRAALAPLVPTKAGSALLIDSGANVECLPEYLLQFAYMGSIYMQKQLGIENPKVGLLNNGSEESKGTPLCRETYVLLKKAHEDGFINFVGNVEGRDAAFGAADVIVTDGFTGNIYLKTVEGIGLFYAGELKNIFMKSALTKMAALALTSGIKAFKKKLDYKETGGAPLLGLEKPIIKAHGSCDAYAFKNAIRQAIIYRESAIIEQIKQNIEHMSAE